MGHLYLSYYHRDKDLTDRLVTDLRAAGVDVWRDVDKLAPGQEFGEATQQALTDADAFAVVSARISYLTPVMAGDLVAAVQRKLPIFLLKFDAKAHIRMSSQYPHTDIEFSPDYASGLRALMAQLPQSVKQVQPLVSEPAKSRGYVFISYAQEDTPFVFSLRDFLKTQGYGYWDYQDSDRNYQTQLFLELEEVIKGAAATIAVLSPDWKRSEWTPKELLFSQQVGTPVFLAMCRQMGPTLVTAGMTYIDFTEDPAAGFARLDRELRRKGLI